MTSTLPDWPDAPSDTLVRRYDGFYLCLGSWADSTPFFRQLPALPPPPADLRLSYLSPPAEYDQPLPRQFRLPGGLQVQMYHHEYAELTLDYPELGGPNPLPRGSCGGEEYQVNAWQYHRQILEYPQLRTAAGPLTALNHALQTRYELVEYDPDLSNYGNRDVGQPVLAFGLSPAALARRPWYREVNSREAERIPDMWHAAYRLLDTTITYQHFPRTASVVELGAGRRLLGLRDYYTNAHQSAERTSFADDLAAESVAYYALPLGRRVRYADVFRPALSQDLWRVMQARLRHQRRRYHVPLLDSTATRELRQQLAEPQSWEFTRHGLYATYLAREDEYEDAHYRYRRRYQDGFDVLIPYARLRAYLR